MAQESKKRSINLSDLLFYVAVILKHARLMVLLVCLSLMVGLTYYVYARPLYFARSLVRMDQVSRPLDNDTIFRDSSGHDLAQQMTAPHIMARTARALGHTIGADKEVNARLVQNVAIRFNSEKNMEVLVWSYQPEVARDWTETLVREFQEYRAEQRSRYHESVLKTYSKEMEEVSAKMREVLKATQEFGDENENTKILVEMNQFELLPDRIGKVKRRLEALESVRIRVETNNVDTVSKLSIISSVLDKDSSVGVGKIVQGEGDEANSKTSVVVVPAMTQAEPKRWEVLEKELRDLRKQEADLAKIYRPAHPKMKPVVEKIAKTQQALDSELDVAVTNYNLSCANLRATLKDLEDQLPRYRGILERDAQYKQDSAKFRASQLSWNVMYENMAKKIASLDFASDKERVYLQFLNHLELRDDRPVSPNKFKLLLYSCLLGLGLAIGIPFLIEFLDHTVSNVEQVESAFDLRGLGIVPRIGDEDLKPLPLLDSQAKADRQLMENFRVIRTNLVLDAGADNPHQAIVVVSAMPQEGKTVVSTNLAVAFSQMGEKTLLIDADLRRGRIHRIFDQSGKTGLSNVLVEDLDWRKVCLPSGRPNLDVMPSGPHLGGATEVFGTGKFETLMKELRANYQRIVIDTPPVLGLSETSMLQPMVDGVLFVIWSGHTPMRNVRAAIELLQANGARFYGFVLNRLDLSSATNYYYYYYYSYDYYENYTQLEKV